MLVWKAHFFKGISVLPNKISSFSFGKIEIIWKNRVLKLTARKRKKRGVVLLVVSV
jgi:hypothetical protein